MRAVDKVPGQALGGTGKLENFAAISSGYNFDGFHAPDKAVYKLTAGRNAIDCCTLRGTLIIYGLWKTNASMTYGRKAA